MATLYYSEGNCFANAYINQRNYYKDRKLKLVFGSLAFNGWWEYGNAAWTYSDFAAKHSAGTYIWDAHAWLEDDAGNIYDFIFPWYNQVAIINTGRPLPKQSSLMEGVSPAEVRARGLTYKAADAFTQERILASALSYIQMREAEFLRTGSVPVGFLSRALNFFTSLIGAEEPKAEPAPASAAEDDDFGTLAQALAQQRKKGGKKGKSKGRR